MGRHLTRPALRSAIHAGVVASADPDPESIIVVDDHVAWLRADNLTKSGDDCSDWLDKFSGSSNNIPQGTPSLQPVVLDTGGPNSQACVQSDGTEYLTSASAMTEISDAFTLWAVLRADGSWANDDRFFRGAAGGATWLAFRMRMFADRWSVTLRSGAEEETETAGVADVWRYIEISMSGTDQYLRVDNNAYQTSAGSTSWAPTAFQVFARGTGNIVAGSIAEIVIKKGFRTDEQNELMQDYFNDRYAAGLTAWAA